MASVSRRNYTLISLLPEKKLSFLCFQKRYVKCATHGLKTASLATTLILTYSIIIIHDQSFRTGCSKTVGLLGVEVHAFSPLYFGSSLWQTTINVKIMLSHNVKKSFQDQEVMSTLNIDIQGVFNKVTDAQLVKKP